jgi:hypothetical protein
MDFDIDPLSIGLTILAWLFCVLVIWKFAVMGGGFPLWQKVTLTVLMLPIIFFIVQWQKNK